MLEFRPVAREALDVLETFSERFGRFRYCSCMRWRMTSTAYKNSTKAERAEALADLVRAGTPVGILALRDGEPVAWCSVAPRDTCAGLERYRALPRLDAVPVWSIVCLFIAPAERGAHLTAELLEAAADHALTAGAPAVEGYPMPPGSTLYAYLGGRAAFEAAGFRDVTPPGRDRTVMRKEPFDLR